jgi:RHS repeat-associated protein
MPGILKLAVLLTVIAAAPVLANAKLEPRAGEALYLIVLDDGAKEFGAAAVGGRVLQSWSDRRLLAVPEERAEALREHDGVAYVQRIWTGGGRPVAAAGAYTPVTAAAVAPSWTTGLYAFDASGNIKSIGTDTFGYDAAGRLVQANVKGTPQSYEFDVYGNLRRLGGREFTVDAATNRLGQYRYNAIGLVTHDDAGRVYHYDPSGKVNAIEPAATDTVTYDTRMIYTADDERIVMAEGSVLRYRVRDYGARILREWKSTGAILEWERDHLYAGSDLVGGEVQVDQRQNGQRHYHTDHLGSVRMVSDGAADLVSQHDYLPYGEEIVPTTTEWTNTAKAPRDPKKFTGHERDYFSAANVDGDAIDYMHARFYAPKSGRFLAPDPGQDWDMNQPQSWNLYAYVRNNPIVNFDATGMQTCTADGPCDDMTYIITAPDPLIMEAGPEFQLGNDDAGLTASAAYDVVGGGFTAQIEGNIGDVKGGLSGGVDNKGKITPPSFSGGAGPGSGSVGTDGSASVGAGGKHGGVTINKDKDGNFSPSLSVKIGIVGVSYKKDEVTISALGLKVGMRPETAIKTAAAVERLTRPLESAMPALGQALRITEARKGVENFFRKIIPPGR